MVFIALCCCFGSQTGLNVGVNMFPKAEGNQFQNRPVCYCGLYADAGAQFQASS